MEVVVDDVITHHDAAVNAGGEVVIPIVDSIVGLSYTLRDLEQNLWHFGVYVPGTFQRSGG